MKIGVEDIETGTAAEFETNDGREAVKRFLEASGMAVKICASSKTRGFRFITKRISEIPVWNSTRQYWEIYGI